MTVRETHLEGTSAAARDGQDGRPLDRRQAQEALLLLGQLGQSISEAMTKRIDSELADNPEVIVVTHLDLRGPSRPAEIIAVTGMTSGGVTKLLDRLEQGGYLRREFGTFPGDRRATVLSLTVEGRRLAADYADALLSVRDEVHEAAVQFLKMGG